MTDLLKRYKPGSHDREPASTETADVGYRAFVSESHQQIRLRIECNSELNHMPAYAQLVDVLDVTSKLNTRILLVFYSVVFRIEGRNLDELLSLLQDAKVKRITEFNSDRWQLPASGEPIITRIRTYDRLGDALAEDKATA